MHLSRAARLEMYVTIHILTLIAALLLLLMLMWHLSAAHLLEDYGMPKSWTEPFLEKHFGGGQGALWSLALIIVRQASVDPALCGGSNGKLMAAGVARFCPCTPLARLLPRLSSQATRRIGHVD